MKRGSGISLVACFTLGACGGALESGTSVDAAKAKPPVLGDAVPRADCAAGSSPELGIQGRVSIEEVQSGRAAEGYWCNLQPVGYLESSAGLTLAKFDHCVYYGGLVGGVAVVDLSDPANPVATDNLVTPAMVSPWESVRVNEKRGLLAAVQGPSSPGFFDVYDLNDDCARPVLKSITPVNVVGHESAWAPDGMTYYATTTFSIDAITAIDVSDPMLPKPVTFSGTHNSHGLSISDDGKRAYLADQKLGANQTGLTIVDTSDIQARNLGAPGIRKIGSVTWTDGATGQHTLPVTVGGRPYVIYVDEGDAGAARFIDLSDEANPAVVSTVKLEIHLPENQALREADGDAYGDGSTLQYDSHYCNVDRQVDPQLLICAMCWSGLRVFDIRDPLRPREIAYANPAPPGNAFNVASPPQFDPATGNVIFTVSGGSRTGLHVWRLDKSLWPLRGQRASSP
jgi:hypothetical protein